MPDYYPKTGVCYQHAERSKIYMIYNFSCNATCDHCLVESNPRRRKKLDPATAKEILRTGAAYGKSFLDLSGGEMMLYPDEVMEVASAARDLGYYICLNTNAFWARNPERARAVLTDLKSAGVQAVFPSASTYHLKYVPLERVKFVRDACRELGMTYELNWVYSDKPDMDQRIQEEMGIEDEVYFYDGLVTNGNNPETMERLKQLYTLRVPDELDDCLSVHLGVNPHGHVVSTCNMTYDNAKFRDTPFFLGNFYEQPFEELLQAERSSPILQFIYGNPHPTLHNLLRSDEEFGEYYQRTFTSRGYYSIIDYYLDLFRDERTLQWLNENLPTPTERVAAAVP